MKKNIEENKYIIDGFNQQMVKAWLGGKFYEAGKLAGLIDVILYKM